MIFLMFILTLVIVFAMIWLMSLRMFLYLTIIAAGVKPFLSGGG